MADACILCGDETIGTLCEICAREYAFEGDDRDGRSGNAKPCEKHNLLHFYDKKCPACELEEELKIARRGAAISSLGQLAANRVAARGGR